jgi:hypothetical protein
MTGSHSEICFEVTVSDTLRDLLKQARSARSAPFGASPDESSTRNGTTGNGSAGFAEPVATTQREAPAVVGTFAPVAHALPDTAPSMAENAARDPAVAAAQETHWRPVALRRDGRRPVRFHGMLVFEAHYGAHQGAQRGGLAAVSPGCHDHNQDHAPADIVGRRTGRGSLALFVARSGEIYAAIAFDPPPCTAARPVRRVHKVDAPEAFRAFVRECGPEACFAVAPDVIRGLKGPFTRVADAPRPASVTAPDMTGPEVMGPEVMGPEVMGPEVIGPDISQQAALGPVLSAMRAEFDTLTETCLRSGQY